MIVLNITVTSQGVMSSHRTDVVMIAVLGTVTDETIYHVEVVAIAHLTPRWIVVVTHILPIAPVIYHIICVRGHILHDDVVVEHMVYVEVPHNARRYRSRRHVMQSQDVPIRRQCEYSSRTQILFMSLSLLD